MAKKQKIYERCLGLGVHASLFQTPSMLESQITCLDDSVRLRIQHRNRPNFELIEPEHFLKSVIEEMRNAANDLTHFANNIEINKDQLLWENDK